jgi:formate hydrogenlyase subunit 5
MTTTPTTAPERPDWLPRQLHGTLEPAPPGEVRLAVGPGGFGTAARVLHEARARFVTMFVAERPERSIVAVLALRGHVILVRAPAPEGRPMHHAALGEWWPAARWPERELAERHGVVPLDGAAGRALTAPDADLIDGRVRGADVFAIPYGPIRSGVFEAIQFLIETGGEDVPRLETRLFFKHRGLERRFRGLEPDRAVHVAERTAGIASVAHATAFSQAVERALGVEPPLRAQRWRAIVAEVERMANHLDVIAKQAETTALFVGQARFQILKENVLRLQAALTGSRFGRGVVMPGGVRHEGRLDPEALLSQLERFEDELRHDRRLFLGTASMTDRLIGTGHLERTLVEESGAVGPLARGSGLSLDARHERPYGDYRRLGTVVQTARAGDAMARVEVRFGELGESVRLLRQAIDHLARGDRELHVEPPRGSGAGLGWVEAPQGELIYWVEVQDGVVSNVHVASPSLRNWALFDDAFPKDVLTDFAFIEHSFGLTPAGADR